MSTTEKDRIDNPDTIDQLAILFDFLRTLPKIWVWLLILVLAGGAISYVRASLSYVPVYTSSATFTINIKKEQSMYGSSTYYDNAAAEQLAQTFPYILTSNLLQRTVAEDMGRPVGGSINAYVTTDTNLLTLSVTGTNPQLTYDTLNSVIKNYPVISEPIVGKVTMNILDETGVPTEPNNPKIFINETLIGAGIGLLVGLAWAVLVFITNRAIQSESDIKKKLGINNLGSVPRISRKERSRAASQYYLITDPKVKDLLAEPFRMIKNKVEFHAHKHNHKTILITSATASEGKSLFAANLVLSLVTSGKNVTFIDCDLRHPTTRLIFGTEQNIGLGEYLKGEIELPDLLAHIKSENIHSYPNFLFIPGGAAISDGSTLLSSSRMQDLISCVEATSDYVILDSAPAGLLTDSVVLAKYADAAIIVIRKDVARIDIINDALGHLAESDIQVIGGVLNDV